MSKGLRYQGGKGGCNDSKAAGAPSALNVGLDAARFRYCVDNGFPSHLQTGWWAYLPNGHRVGKKNPGCATATEAIDMAMLLMYNANANDGQDRQNKR